MTKLILLTIFSIPLIFNTSVNASDSIKCGEKRKIERSLVRSFESAELYNPLAKRIETYSAMALCQLNTQEVYDWYTELQGISITKSFDAAKTRLLKFEKDCTNSNPSANVIDITDYHSNIERQRALYSYPVHGDSDYRYKCQVGASVTITHQCVCN